MENFLEVEVGFVCNIKVLVIVADIVGGGCLCGFYGGLLIVDGILEVVIFGNEELNGVLVEVFVVVVN